MKKRMTQTLFGLVLGLLAACSRPASLTPAPAPNTPTPLAPPPSAPTLTPLPPTATPLPVPITTLTELHMQDADRGWAWASKPDNSFLLLSTADGGLTWKDVTPPNLPVVSFGSFFLDAGSAWVQLFDSTNNSNGLAHSADGGKTWSALNKALPFANAALTFEDAAVGWAETYDVGAGQAYVQLYQTQDGGTTWKQVLLTGPAAEAQAPDGALHLCNICGDSFSYDPSCMVITRGDLASEPGGFVRLSISTDLGKTWKDLKLPLPSGQYAGDLIAPHAPVFFNPRDGFLPVQMTANDAGFATTLAVYVTHDGGQTWDASSSFVEDASPYDLVKFVSQQDGFARCGNDLCATHDGAQTWKTLPPGLNFSSTSGGDYVFHYNFVDAVTGWAITTDGTTATLWKTVDGGKTWNKLAPVLVP